MGGDSYGGLAADATGGGFDLKELLLHFRDGATAHEGTGRREGPDVGEAELSLVHFIVHAKMYWGKEFARWLITSVEPDLWMIILIGMSTGHIKTEGVGLVDVTVLKVVGGAAKYIWVNRVFTAICKLKDGSESAWPRPVSTAGSPIETRGPVSLS